MFQLEESRAEEGAESQGGDTSLHRKKKKKMELLSALCSSTNVMIICGVGHLFPSLALVG